MIVDGDRWTKHRHTLPWPMGSLFNLVSNQLRNYGKTIFRSQH